MIVVVWHSMSSIRSEPQKWSPITQNTHIWWQEISSTYCHYHLDPPTWRRMLKPSVKPCKPKKENINAHPNQFFSTEKWQMWESFKLKEDVQMDFQFTEFAPFPSNRKVARWRFIPNRSGHDFWDNNNLKCFLSIFPNIFISYEKWMDDSNGNTFVYLPHFLCVATDVYSF